MMPGTDFDMRRDFPSIETRKIPVNARLNLNDVAGDVILSVLEER
jgi:hypothetical protein